MSDQATIQWMKEQDSLKYWILLDLEFNAVTACYDYVVGKPPEVIPLDVSLFNDLDSGIE